MLAVNAAVGWHPPEVGSGRFGAWLENNVDWALSRDRYWGTPLCVWECDATPEHREVVGSFAELAERWGRPLPADFDPHKPHIDGYAWPCGTCAGTMRRVPEVIDAWFDSGSMPYAQWHYPFAGEAEFLTLSPADAGRYGSLAKAMGVADKPRVLPLDLGDETLEHRTEWWELPEVRAARQCSAGHPYSPRGIEGEVVDRLVVVRIELDGALERELGLLDAPRLVEHLADPVLDHGVPRV